MKHLFTIPLALMVAVPAMADMSGETYSRWVDDKGETRLPENYRTTWTHLGSWVVADEKAPGKGFHDVYTQPEAAAYYLQHGRFPDGAVLVKEIRTLQTGFKTTGPAQWAGENAVWFVMIKDDKRRFKNHPHWAEGWGWAMYEASNPALNTSKSFTETCQSCHIPARATDWVFVEGYPTLKP
ncbi:cytochrome P460 family protein [Methylocaldum gracile]